jgi:TFIIF-interacting CTD phosphatase-like protein
MLQPENGIPIVSWYDDMSDRLLYEYIPFLIELAKVPDMREVITSAVRNNTLDAQTAQSVCVSILEHENRNQRK